MICNSEICPKRIAIIGLPGSGKSTFAAKLGRALSIPVHHLDRHMFEGDKKRDREEFLSIQKAILAEKAWVIEGCSLSTLELRFASADVVLYFHLPRWLCIWRIFKRFFIYLGRACRHTSDDMEHGGLKTVRWELLKYMWTFDRDKRPGIEALRRKYPHVKFLIFITSTEVNRYLAELAGEVKAKS